MSAAAARWCAFLLLIVYISVSRALHGAELRNYGVTLPVQADPQQNGMAENAEMQELNIRHVNARLKLSSSHLGAGSNQWNWVRRQQAPPVLHCAGSSRDGGRLSIDRQQGWKLIWQQQEQQAGEVQGRSPAFTSHRLLLQQPTGNNSSNGTTALVPSISYTYLNHTLTEASLIPFDGDAQGGVRVSHWVVTAWSISNFDPALLNEATVQHMHEIIATYMNVTTSQVSILVAR